MMMSWSKMRLSAGRFRNDQSGTTMVEFAICIALFLLILFAVLDFGRLGYNWVMAEKGMQRAVRIAAVRPPVCANVPQYHRAPAGVTTGLTAGMLCRSGANICDDTVAVSCTLNEYIGGTSEGSATAVEIWAAVQNLVPQNTTPANVRLLYQYDPKLGFLGGPFVPNITAELVGEVINADEGSFEDLPFTFITPLSALAATAGDQNVDDIPATIPFPDISVTLPAEDMNLGVRG